MILHNSSPLKAGSMPSLIQKTGKVHKDSGTFKTEQDVLEVLLKIQGIYPANQTYTIPVTDDSSADAPHTSQHLALPCTFNFITALSIRNIPKRMDWAHHRSPDDERIKISQSMNSKHGTCMQKIVGKLLICLKISPVFSAGYNFFSTLVKLVR
jgi:hypothetical protein